MPSTEGETNLKPVGEPEGSSTVRKRSRRGRGRRGRQSRRQAVLPASLPVAPSIEPPGTVTSPAEVPASPPQEKQPPPQTHPIQRAIEEVNQIILSLKTVLGEMEEVLELLEMAEVQKEVDEREILALHQALKRLQRGHEHHHSSGAPPHPREQQSQPR